MQRFRQFFELLHIGFRDIRIDHLQRVMQLFHVDDGAVQMMQMREFVFELLRGRQELVDRRIEQAYRHRQAVHGAEDAAEILALDRQQLVERDLAIGGRFGEDHVLHDRQTIDVVEHALGTAQPDAVGAKAPCALPRRAAYRHWPSP